MGSSSRSIASRSRYPPVSTPTARSARAAGLSRLLRAGFLVSLHEGLGEWPDPLFGLCRSVYHPAGARVNLRLDPAVDFLYNDSGPAEGHGEVAQWKSRGLISPWLWVRLPPSPLKPRSIHRTCPKGRVCGLWLAEKSWPPMKPHFRPTRLPGSRGGSPCGCVLAPIGRLSPTLAGHRTPSLMSGGSMPPRSLTLAGPPTAAPREPWEQFMNRPNTLYRMLLKDLCPGG